MHKINILFHNNNGIPRILSYFWSRGDNNMKKTWKFLVAGALGVGAVALYKKYNPDMMHDIKASVNKMSKNATKSIENMM